ncbi:MAG: hypothetical protein NC321_02700 [Clostridium sp.]|nr:hypothetical protein [Clostridium sp.]
MELESLDELREAKMLVRGLCDVMYEMKKTAAQDTQIPAAVFYPFEVVLEKVCRLLEETGKREKTKNLI